MADNSGFGAAFGLPGMMGGMKPPAMPDLGALAQSHQRNLETLMQVNALVLGGVQALAQRQMQIMQESVTQMTGMMGSPPRDMAQPMAAAQAACARGAAQMSEMAEMVQRTGTQAAALLERRFAEAMTEIGSLAPKG